MSDARDMRNDRMEGETPIESEPSAMSGDTMDRGGETMNGRGEIVREDMRDMRDMREDARERDRERMGPDEPMPRTTREPVTASGTTASERRAMESRDLESRGMGPHDIDSEIWPDMTDLHQRFDAIQAEFIEDPKDAVRRAEELVKEIVDRITRSMNERMATMHSGVDKSSDTEQLRQTMKGYRDLVVWMETRRAA